MGLALYSLLGKVLSAALRPTYERQQGMHTSLKCRSRPAIFSRSIIRQWAWCKSSAYFAATVRAKDAFTRLDAPSRLFSTKGNCRDLHLLACYSICLYL